MIATNRVTRDQYITRAGPGGEGRSGVGFKELKAQYGGWNDTLRFDQPSITKAIQHVGIVNMSYDEVKLAMIKFADKTNSSSIIYSPIGGGVVGYNSNSYAFTFIESLGFDRPIPKRSSPGWENGTPDPNLKRSTP